ncbi:MAG: PmoA family protein [Candidatus Latescibacteria bacterium]|jgi:hypothetical protein|nr:PmoA family protein [Candidatus Latescibacterota bacterium]
MSDIALQVDAGYHQRYACPVSIRLERRMSGAVTIEDVATGKRYPGYCTDSNETSTLHWIIESMEAQETRTFAVHPESLDTKGVVVTGVSDGKVDVSVGGAHFTSYHCGPAVARPFCYPVNDTKGTSVTRNAIDDETGEQVDHWWHRSLWVAFGEVNEANNWDELEGHGRTVHDRYEGSGNPVFGDLIGHGDWLTREGDPIMREQRRMRFYDVGDAPLRIFDVDLDLRAINGDVNFGDTKEGGFLSVRVAPSMNASGLGKIENSFGGINEGECWGKRANWCDYSGPVDGHTAGIAVLEHPDTFRSPTYWHVRNYGLMGTNPFGVSTFRGNPDISGAYTLPDGDTLSFSYRVVVHQGDARDAKIEGQYIQYIHPPVISLLDS